MYLYLTYIKLYMLYKYSPFIIFNLYDPICNLYKTFCTYVAYMNLYVTYTYLYEPIYILCTYI